MLSPRRVKPAPTVVLYELRMIRPTTRAEKLARMFESSVKKWRGVARWYLQAHTSARGEAVLQVVIERYAHMARLDNLFTSWRRALGKELQLSKDGAGIKRAVWTAIGAESYMVDVRVMHDVFDAAIAKLWVEIAGAADASRCSYIEPAMPPPQHLLQPRSGASGASAQPVMQKPALPPLLPVMPPKTAQLSALPTPVKTVFLGT